MIGRLHDGFTERLPLRVRWVPIGSTLMGSAMGALPVIATEPIVPPFGLMILLAWRLLRPELWPAWMALPLGLADDLLCGHYLGTAVILWTVAFLILEWVDQLVLWRDGRIEWAIASVAIVAIGAGSWLFSQPSGSGTSLLVLMPQTVGAILCFPAVLRLTAMLDRWRLKR